ncbi:hypothetical protein LSH36_425g02064, partial [Paralvinella palmiformis]
MLGIYGKLRLENAPMTNLQFNESDADDEDSSAI